MRSSRTNLAKIWLTASLALGVLTGLPVQGQSRAVKALVGGTLIDGYGSKPLHDSVIILLDFIAVRGDVLRHINLLQNVEIVIKRGSRYK